MSCRRLAELLVRLGKHLVGASEVVEVVHILRAEIELQGREHVGRGEADLLRLLAVDVGVERRRAGIVEGEDTRESRSLLAAATSALVASASSCGV